MESNKDVALYQSNHSRYNRIGKRNADIIVSMALIIIFISSLFLFSFILLLFSGGPVF